MYQVSFIGISYRLPCSWLTQMEGNALVYDYRLPKQLVTISICLINNYKQLRNLGNVLMTLIGLECYQQFQKGTQKITLNNFLFLFLIDFPRSHLIVNLWPLMLYNIFQTSEIILRTKFCLMGKLHKLKAYKYSGLIVNLSENFDDY